MKITVLRCQQGVVKYIAVLSLKSLLRLRQKLNWEHLPIEAVPQRKTGNKHVQGIVKYLESKDNFNIAPIICNLRGAQILPHPRVSGAYQLSIPDDLRKCLYPLDGSHRLAAIARIADENPAIFQSKLAECQITIELYLDLSEAEQHAIFISLNLGKPVPKEVLVAKGDRQDFATIREVASKYFPGLVEFERKSPLSTEIKAYSLCQLYDCFTVATRGFYGATLQLSADELRDLATAVRSHPDFETLMEDPTVKRRSHLFEPFVLTCLMTALWRMRFQRKPDELGRAVRALNFMHKLGAIQNPFFKDLAGDKGFIKKDTQSKTELIERFQRSLQIRSKEASTSENLNVDDFDAELEEVYP